MPKTKLYRVLVPSTWNWQGPVQEDILEITEREQGYFVLSGVHPPRYIRQEDSIEALEQFIETSGLYKILEVV